MTQQQAYSDPRVLCVGIDVSAESWGVAFATSGNQRAPYMKIPRKDAPRLAAAIASARKKLGLPDECRVVSTYEAGRDGFWIHRWLEAQGFENVVVHAASIKVDQRTRRPKTDRLDARLLVQSLVRHVAGERDVWKVVRVPTVEQEDSRRPQRELERLKKERTQHLTRINSLLVTQGLYVESTRRAVAHLDELRAWDGSVLPPKLRAELEREAERLEIVSRQIQEINAAREAAMREAADDLTRLVSKIASLRGVGLDSAWLLGTEFFGWRQFKNRGEVAGAAGLGGTPFSSGAKGHDQGIGKDGNRRVRTRMIELAWKWLQYQPDSDLTAWFHRYAASGRLRRVGIVAVARKLLVAIWHYVEHDIVPRNAALKAVA